MKTFNKTLLAFAALAIAFASNAASKDAVYIYEVRSPSLEAPVVIRVKLGEADSANGPRSEIEFTQSSTTVSARDWSDMVKVGTTPAHDFVTCGRKTCTYGDKGKAYGGVKITVRPIEKDGVVITFVSFDRSEAQLTGAPGNLPRVDGLTILANGALSAGEVLPIFASNETAALVKLVSIEN